MKVESFRRERCILYCMKACAESSHETGHVHPRAPLGLISRARIRLVTLLSSWVPIGYQDETGFHIGEMS
jgi:hypothetical protein